MPRRKSHPIRKSRIAHFSEDAASQQETSSVSSRRDESSTATVGEERSISEDGHTRTGQGTGTSNSETLEVATVNASLGGTKNRMDDEENHEKVTPTRTVRRSKRLRSTKLPEQVSHNTRRTVKSEARSLGNQSKSAAGSQPSVRPESKVETQREHTVEQLQPVVKKEPSDAALQLSETLKEFTNVDEPNLAAESVPAVEQSKSSLRGKKAGKKSPRRRQYMPTKKPRSKNVPKGEPACSRSKTLQKKKRPLKVETQILSEEGEGELPDEHLDTTRNGGLSDPLLDGPYYWSVPAATLEKAFVVEDTCEQLESAAKETDLRKKLNTTAKEGPRSKKFETALGSDDVLAVLPVGQTASMQSAKRGDPVHEQPVARSVKKTPRRRRYMPTRKSQPKKVSKGELEESRSKTSQKRKQPLGMKTQTFLENSQGELPKSPSKDMSSGENFDTTRNGGLSDPLLEGPYRWNLPDTAMEKVFVVEDACEQSESATKKADPRKQLKNTTKEGPRSKKSKISLDLDDVLVMSSVRPTASMQSEERRKPFCEQPVPKSVKKTPRRRRRYMPSRPKPRRQSDRSMSRIASTVTAGSKQAAMSLKGTFGAEKRSAPRQTRVTAAADAKHALPGEQSCTKLSRPLARESTGEQADKEMHRARKRNADLVDNFCNHHPDLETCTCRRQPNPVKKARSQKPGINCANEGRVAGKARVTEWQLTRRTTSQWAPVSSGAEHLTLDVMQSSAG